MVMGAVGVPPESWKVTRPLAPSCTAPASPLLRPTVMVMALLSVRSAVADCCAAVSVRVSVPLVVGLLPSETVMVSVGSLNSSAMAVRVMVPVVVVCPAAGLMVSEVPVGSALQSSPGLVGTSAQPSTEKGISALAVSSAPAMVTVKTAVPSAPMPPSMNLSLAPSSSLAMLTVALSSSVMVTSA